MRAKYDVLRSHFHPSTDAFSHRKGKRFKLLSKVDQDLYLVQFKDGQIIAALKKEIYVDAGDKP
jgi:hypothetical protein